MRIQRSTGEEFELSRGPRGLWARGRWCLSYVDFSWPVLSRTPSVRATVTSWYTYAHIHRQKLVYVSIVRDLYATSRANLGYCWVLGVRIKPVYSSREILGEKSTGGPCLLRGTFLWHSTLFGCCCTNPTSLIQFRVIDAQKMGDHSVPWDIKWLISVHRLIVILVTLIHFFSST